MLFDEPASTLDPELTGEVVDVMERLAGEGMTMVVVSHEMHFACDVAERIIFMEGGNWVEAGPPEKLLRNPDQERTRRFLSHIIRDTEQQERGQPSGEVFLERDFEAETPHMKRKAAHE